MKNLLSNPTSITRLALIAAALLMAVSIGCGDSDSGGASSGGGDSAGSTDAGNDTNDGKKFKIAFVTNQIASFWNIAEVGCNDAAEDLGIEAVVKFPTEATATKQKQIVEDLLSSGIDALAISPIDSGNQKDTLNDWAGQIPMLTHDSDAPETNRLMYIGVDNYEAGRTLGKLIKNARPDGAKMILTVGRLEQLNAQLRRQGVIDELLGREPDDTRRDPIEGEVKSDKYTIYATLTDQGKPEVAQQKAEDALNAYPELTMFVGLFAYNPPACLQAIRQADKLDDVTVAGFDEEDATLQGIKDGHVIGTVVQNPYDYGYKSMEMLNEILKGNKGVIPESKYLDCPARAVTSDGREIGGVKTEVVDAFWADLKEKTGN